MAWSKKQWETHIRGCCQDTSNIAWTKHAKTRMRERKITMAVALDILRNGTIKLEPEPDIKTGHMVCRIERYCAGSTIALSVALEEEGATTCIVVTAINL